MKPLWRRSRAYMSIMNERALTPKAVSNALSLPERVASSPSHHSVTRHHVVLGGRSVRSGPGRVEHLCAWTGYSPRPAGLQESEKVPANRYLCSMLYAWRRRQLRCRRWRVLVVDDDDFFAEAVKALLETDGRLQIAGRAR